MIMKLRNILIVSIALGLASVFLGPFKHQPKPPIFVEHNQANDFYHCTNSDGVIIWPAQSRTIYVDSVSVCLSVID